MENQILKAINHIKYNNKKKTEFGSKWMSIEGKSFWTVLAINECYVYCFSLR